MVFVYHPSSGYPRKILHVVLKIAPSKYSNYYNKINTFIGLTLKNVKTTKSNINFDSIEFEISDKELESIKKSILQGCIKKVDQLSMHKWHYILKAEDKLIETEICYNKSNIKSFLCACGTKSPSKACKHVLLLSYWHATTILKNKEVSQINDYQIKSKLENSTNEDLKY
jgi:hypothetical protein